MRAAEDLQCNQLLELAKEHVAHNLLETARGLSANLQIKGPLSVSASRRAENPCHSCPAQSFLACRLPRITLLGGIAIRCTLKLLCSMTLMGCPFTLASKDGVKSS